MKKLIFIVLALLPVISFASNASEADRVRIETAVTQSVSAYLERLDHPYSNKGYATAYYDIQSTFQNSLRYARETGNTFILDELSTLVLKSAKNLKRTQFYVFQSKTCEVKRLNDYYLMWLPPESYKCNGKMVGKETILDTAQYSYFVASLINAITESTRPTANMVAVVKLLPRIIAYDQYYRLIFKSYPFNRFGWGCGIGDFNGYQTIAVLKKRLYGKLPKATNTKPYCNAVTDTELLLLGGVAELFAASEKRTGILYPVLKSLFRSYLNAGSVLLKTRTKDYEISPGVWGQTFGHGDWDGHPDYKYSDYTGNTYPTESNQASTSTSMDVSHARRIIHVFESMLNVRDIAGFSYPSRQDMERIANQFYYKAFNGDLNNPLFSNYLDGGNGWYRVGYVGRNGYGIAPYGLTDEVPAGGYGFLGKYLTEIRPVIAKALENKPNDLQGLASIAVLK